MRQVNGVAGNTVPSGTKARTPNLASATASEHVFYGLAVNECRPSSASEQTSSITTDVAAKKQGKEISNVYHICLTIWLYAFVG